VPTIESLDREEAKAINGSTDDSIKDQAEICAPAVSEKMESEINEKQTEATDSLLKSCKTDVPEESQTPQISSTQKVYRWASSNVGESEGGEDKFYVAQPYPDLLYKLQNTEKSLNMVTGLQGTGKTRLLCELWQDNRGRIREDYLRIKWTKNWKKEFMENGLRLLVQPGGFRSAYNFNLECEFEKLVRILEENGQVAKLKKIGNPRTYENELDYESIEAFIGKAKCKQLKEDAFSEALAKIRVLMVDMPDYNKSNANAMNHDIDAIQEFYESLETRYKTHIIIAVQKELLLKNPHFFWNKCDKYTIEPLAPSQLIEAYKLNNPGTEIFDHAALLYLAEVSRGVFRRFKKYIRLSIEANREKQPPISEELTKKTITDDIVFEDMDQELADIFDDAEKRKCASRILSYLRSNSDVNVKTIAGDIGISETMAQKIVQKLALYGYISTKHGHEGKEKLVSLQL
jgi:hypothetical protein